MSGQRRYQSFCREASITILPLSEHKTCLFVAHLVRSGLKPSTIKVYLSVVRCLQVETGLGDPFIASWPVLESVVKGAKRKEVESGRQEKGRLLMTPGLMTIFARHLCLHRAHF